MDVETKQMPEVKHDIENCRFFLIFGGVTAFVKYLVEDDTIDIRHTIVPKEISGLGFASKLVETTYKWGDENGLKPRASCSYAAVWCKRHGIQLPERRDGDQFSCAF